MALESSPEAIGNSTIDDILIGAFALYRSGSARRILGALNEVRHMTYVPSSVHYLMILEVWKAGTGGYWELRAASKSRQSIAWARASGGVPGDSIGSKGVGMTDTGSQEYCAIQRDTMAATMV